jgi:hypothetical protein
VATLVKLLAAVCTMSAAAAAISPPASIAPAATSVVTAIAVETGFCAPASTPRCPFVCDFDELRFEAAFTGPVVADLRFEAVFAGLAFAGEARFDDAFAGLVFAGEARFDDAFAGLRFVDKVRLEAPFLEAAVVFAAVGRRALPPVRDFDEVVLGDRAISNSFSVNSYDSCMLSARHDGDARLRAMTDAELTAAALGEPLA